MYIEREILFTIIWFKGSAYVNHALIWTSTKQ